MEPTEFLKFAQGIMCDKPGPVECRSALSRAYYAAFHYCRQKLVAHGIRVPQNAHAHRLVQSGLRNSSNPAYEKVGSQLNDLQARRIYADYELGKTAVEDPKGARFYVEVADRLITQMSRFDSDPDLDAILAAVRSYLEKAG